MRGTGRLLLAVAILAGHLWVLPLMPAGAADVVLHAGPNTTVTVVTDPATEIGLTHARLNGYISEDNGTACQYRFSYGLTVAYGSNTSWGVFSGVPVTSVRATSTAMAIWT